MKKNVKKLLIIGIMPPPIGGITIYVKRLTKWLKINEFEHDFLDIRKDSLLQIIRNPVRLIFLADMEIHKTILKIMA